MSVIPPQATTTISAPVLPGRPIPIGRRGVRSVFYGYFLNDNEEGTDKKETEQDRATDDAEMGVVSAENAGGCAGSEEGGHAIALSQIY